MFRSSTFRASNSSKLFVALAAFAAGLVSAQAGEVFPSEDWVDDYDPIASPDAVVGGKVRIALGPYPSSFNAISNYAWQSITVFSHIYDPLMDLDPVSLEWRPRIADKIEVSDDQLEFTVHMNPKAHWNDGTPITTADFKFTLDLIMDPKNMVGPFRYAYEGFEEPEIIDDHTFKIRSTELHWRNLNSIAQFLVLPKHYFEGKDFNKVNFEFPVVSGLYEITDLKEGISMTLTRRDDWWLSDQKRYMGIDNFGTIEYRFYPEREMIFEAFRNGDVDIFGQLTSTIWNEGAKGEEFEKNWIIKQAVFNDEPAPYQGYAINMRRAPLDDKRVRQALCYLQDRKRINETMLYNQYYLIESYMTKLYDEENPITNPPYEFNPAKARELLSEAGWKVDPEDGKLKKDGRPFVINFLLRAPEWSRFLVVYQEALKDVGIEMNIQMTDWAGWSKEMDEFNYDITLAAWGTPIFMDPEGGWHSSQAEVKGGNNISGISNVELDALIEEQKSIFDVNERNKLLRKMDKIVYDEVPMVLGWMIEFKRLFYWNKFGMPDTVLDKYNDEEAAYHYWYIDPDQKADLEYAMEAGVALPPRPAEVRFSETFQGN